MFGFHSIHFPNEWGVVASSSSLLKSFQLFPLNTFRQRVGREANAQVLDRAISEGLSPVSTQYISPTSGEASPEDLEGITDADN
jgi:hypothetical protein